MGIVKNEDVIGYSLDDGEIFCDNCIPPRQVEGLKENNLLTNKDAEEKELHIFCDMCGKKIY
jgi:hypothetical protein